MSLQKQFQKIILGNVSAFSEIEKARIMFSAGTIVVIILLSLVFLVYDIYLGFPSSLFIYPPFILLFCYALHLLRTGSYESGRNLLLVGLNFIVYIILSSIPGDPLSASFYIGVMVVEYVLLGNDKKLELFALFTLTFILYLSDAYLDISPLPMRYYDESTLQVNKTIDFVLCAVGILMSIKLLIDYLQKIIAEQTKSNEELKRLNNELDRYSYTITHDLKGPIHSMLRLVQLPVIDKNNYNQYLDSMRESLQNIWGLIQDVSEQTRNRNFEVSKEVFNMSETVEIIWELVRYAPEAQGINLITDIPKDLKIETDKRRMIGILNNLITNSIRYQDKSRNKRFIQVSAHVSNHWLHLCVEDNGMGIAPEHQQKVFEMFYRGSEMNGGSGLGLFTVKESIDKLMGHIELESQFGKGTTFNIRIPIAHQE